MRRSSDRLLTTHAGSLPRPAALVRLYVRRARGEPVSEDELAAAGREALDQVVARQIDIGIDLVGNGEQQRDSFFLYIRDRLSGFGGAWTRPIGADRALHPDYARMMEETVGREAMSNVADVPMAIGEVAHLDPELPARESADLRAALAPYRGRYAGAFVTAPSPGLIATAMRNAHYDSEAAYLAALGRALQVEYEAAVAGGLDLQIDCPDLGAERHVTFKDRPLADFIAFAESVVATINAALENIPAERVRLHACWGNYDGPHDCDVPLGELIPVLREAKVSAYVLPFANPRHAHEYRLLGRLVGDTDRAVVAGVINTVSNIVEHPEAVADMLVRIAETLGDPTRLVAGTDCGFDTAAGAGRVAGDVAWSKLASLVAGARIASQRLYG